MLNRKKYPLLTFIIFSLFLQGCTYSQENEVQGYIEGRYTYIATSVSGVLKQIFVERGTSVKTGQRLFILEEKPESDAYQAALSNMKQAISARDVIVANLAYAKLTLERNKILVKKNVTQQSQLDNARSIYDALNAQLTQSTATVSSASAEAEQAKWKLGQKISSSPINAIVFDTYYRPGEYTIANQAIVSLLAPGDIKAIFYVNEYQLSAIQLGKKISVKCDGCKHTYTGNISFISPTVEYTPPVIYSNQTNNKLVFRIEAQFQTKDALHLHPGQPVTVKYR